MPVYLIRNATSGLVKIGHSINPAQRLSGIQTSCSDHIYIERLLLGGRKEEKMLHKKFADRRQRGEWFRLSVEESTGDLGISDLPASEPLSKIRGGAGRPMLGDHVLTPAERTARLRQRHAEYVARLEESIRRIAEEAHTLSEAKEIAVGIIDGERR
jgi:hypothetical protein